jgi:probable F420-dependent oxidoreductase
MKFWLSLAVTEMDQLIELAKLAEDLGYAGVTLADHLVKPRDIASRYPYTEDGSPFWQADEPFPDPWVLFAAMAQETTRLRFMTNVYVLPMRDPFTVAKLLSSAAALSGDRIVLGAGTGWMEEEFTLTGREFARRGRRTDEMIEVIAKLLSGECVDHRGEFYQFDAVRMTPAAAHPIEVRIGGLNRLGLRRAARHDGWLGLGHTPEEVQDIVSFLRSERQRLGREQRPFDVMIAHYPASPETGDYERYRDAGVDSVNVPPWRYRGIVESSFDEKRRSMEDFAEHYIVPLAT